MGEDRLQGRRRQGLLPLSDHGLHWLVLRKEVAAGVRNRLARHQGHLEGNGQQLPGQRCAAGMRVTDEWQALTDEQLAEVAHQDLRGQGAPVEAMRRLRVAIEKLNVNSDNPARLMSRFTIVVVFLTLVQAIAAVAAIIAAFPVIQAWFQTAFPVIQAWFQTAFPVIPAWFH